MRQGPELEHPGQSQQGIVVQPREEFIHHLRRRGGKPGGARSQARAASRSRAVSPDDACDLLAESFNAGPLIHHHLERKLQVLHGLKRQLRLVDLAASEPAPRPGEVLGRLAYRSSVAASRSTGALSSAETSSVIDCRTQAKHLRHPTEMKKRRRFSPCRLPTSSSMPEVMPQTGRKVKKKTSLGQRLQNAPLTFQQGSPPATARIPPSPCPSSVTAGLRLHAAPRSRATWPRCR